MVRRTRISQEKRDEIERLYTATEGKILTVHEICKKLNTAPSTVHRVAVAENLKRSDEFLIQSFRERHKNSNRKHWLELSKHTIAQIEKALVKDKKPKSYIYKRFNLTYTGLKELVDAKEWFKDTWKDVRFDTPERHMHCKDAREWHPVTSDHVFNKAHVDNSIALEPYRESAPVDDYHGSDEYYANHMVTALQENGY